MSTHPAHLPPPNLARMVASSLLAAGGSRRGTAEEADSNANMALGLIADQLTRARCTEPEQAAMLTAGTGALCAGIRAHSGTLNLSAAGREIGHELVRAYGRLRTEFPARDLTRAFTALGRAVFHDIQDNGTNFDAAFWTHTGAIIEQERLPAARSNAPAQAL